MSYVRGNCGRKTPYEKKYSRKNKEQEEWVLEKSVLDSSAGRVSDLLTILEQFESRSEEGRKCAINNLIRTVRERGCEDEDLDRNKKLLVQFLVQSIHRSSEEASLAFDCIDVLAATYGTDEEYFNGLLGSVRSIALTPAPDTLENEQQKVIGAAMRSYGVLCFFCCDNDDAIVDIIRTIDNVINIEPKKSSQPVLAAALGAWELIHTTTAFSDEYHQRMIAPIWRHLKSGKSTVDTRMAAGRALAFSFWRASNPGDTIEILRLWIPDIDRLTLIMNECAFGTSHPKVDRAKEQPLFKLLVEWMIEGGDAPSETVTINDSKVVFDSWAILARLATVRRIVGAGLLPQLVSNSVLSEVLQYEVPVKGKKHMSAAEKKYARYCANLADKARTTWLSKSRDGSIALDD